MGPPPSVLGSGVFPPAPPTSPASPAAPPATSPVPPALMPPVPVPPVAAPPVPLLVPLVVVTRPKPPIGGAPYAAWAAQVVLALVTVPLLVTAVVVTAVVVTVVELPFVFVPPSGDEEFAAVSSEERSVSPAQATLDTPSSTNAARLMRAAGARRPPVV